MICVTYKDLCCSLQIENILLGTPPLHLMARDHCSPWCGFWVHLHRSYCMVKTCSSHSTLHPLDLKSVILLELFKLLISVTHMDLCCNLEIQNILPGTPFLRMMERVCRSPWCELWIHRHRSYCTAQTESTYSIFHQLGLKFYFELF